MQPFPAVQPAIQRDHDMAESRPEMIGNCSEPHLGTANGERGKDMRHQWRLAGGCRLTFLSRFDDTTAHDRVLA
ncbi:MAG TPA: hypothetical protein VHO91_20145 [Rhodopila sp.]|nr:hypothetical protein [Rhodopila sp.]